MKKKTNKICGNNIRIRKGKIGNTALNKKGKNMRKTVKTYLSGFKIETFSPVSMALWVGAMALSLYTPHEGNLYVALLQSKAVFVCLFLGMLLIKILLLRRLDRLFDIVTLIILMSSLMN
ncbi:hypothetical protein [uncultured Bilophila sp.]|uniref:hypothetical protein n=1 Tax=uncultured Bilophila sp. TaxID=529385 RepID=UPI00266EFE64|nr:hypothetical protein [uncultured Bilophila sp.]